MSRNRTTTRCECGFWDFKDVPGQARLATGHPGLVSWPQLCTQRGWDPGARGEPGWSYRTDLEGRVFQWFSSPDGTSMSSTPGEGRTVLRETRYGHVAPEDRYRFAKVACGVCRRPYLAWYVLQPSQIQPPPKEAPTYEVYDTSYWYAFNDEPCPDDLDGIVEWTGELIAEAAREFVERHPDRFKRG